jgi:hypothetical protein
MRYVPNRWFSELEKRQLSYADYMERMFALPAVPQAAEAVWGVDPDRGAKLARHQSGETLMLRNVGVLCEGYNDPSICCIVLASPTKSNLRFTQTVGRGTRVFEGKENCLVLDVIDSTKHHSLISLPSLLGLPTGLNLHGESAVEAIGVIEGALRERPHLDMSGLKDLNKIEEYITRVNFWDADVPEEVERHSELTWYRSLRGYVLNLPAMEKLEIAENVLGTFDISGMLGSKAVAATVESIELAFALADEMVSFATPQHLNILTRNDE